MLIGLWLGITIARELRGLAQAVRELHSQNAAPVPTTAPTPPAAPQLISVLADEETLTLEAPDLPDTADETLADYERSTGTTALPGGLHDVCPAWELADEREFNDQQTRRKKASPLRRIDALMRGGSR